MATIPSSLLTIQNQLDENLNQEYLSMKLKSESFDTIAKKVLQEELVEMFRSCPRAHEQGDPGVKSRVANSRKFTPVFGEKLKAIIPCGSYTILGLSKAVQLANLYDFSCVIEIIHGKFSRINKSIGDGCSGK